MFFTATKGPKAFFSTKKILFLKENFLQKNIAHIKKINVKFSQIFLMIISSQKRQNKIAKTKKAPGNRIRVNRQFATKYDQAHMSNTLFDRCF